MILADSPMTITRASRDIIAVKNAVGFDCTLRLLRAELARHEFRVLSEVDFSYELDSRVGISVWPYAVLIVWHPFLAYQALLSDPEGGLMVPFNVALYQNGKVTTVSVLNQPARTSEASVGIRVLGQDLDRKMREVFLHLGEEQIPNSHRRARRAVMAWS